MAENKAPADFRGRFAVGDFAGVLWLEATGSCPQPYRHPGEGRDLTLSGYRTGEIPAFAGMTEKGKAGIHPKTAIRHKKLSYMARLCQLSFQLFQHVDKPCHRPPCRRAAESGAASPAEAADWRPHKADLS
ncbi:MAG: hypothetical protein ACOY4C_05920 [Pseudomonadota bacterium]